MNTPTAELNSSTEGNAGPHEPSSKCPDLDKGPPTTPVAPCWMGPPLDAALPGILPHPHQYSVQTGVVDPLSFRFHYPCQSAQCQMTCPDYFLEHHQPSQYDLLTGPVLGPAGSSHHSPFSAPWFTSEPALCGVMPAIDHQQVHGGLAGVITQPAVCNVTEGGQVVAVNHCEPAPVFLTLEPALAHRDDSPGQGEELSVLGNPSQPPQYPQTACLLCDSSDQTACMHPEAPQARTVGESKLRKPCHCTRSQCLKLYCECFASGVMCSNCDCSNCHNNAEHELKRHQAIKSCLGRNPDAFRPKIAGGKSGEVKGWHNKGCNCKRSSCLKNYCECYEANIMCTSSCKCVGCRNYDDGSEMGRVEKGVKDKQPVSVMTPAVVEAVCGRLLARAAEAEREDRGSAWGEHVVLDEFNLCLTQIVKAMFKHNTQ